MIAETGHYTTVAESKADGALQILTVLRRSDAPTEYTYRPSLGTLPAKIIAAGNGSVTVSAVDGGEEISVPPAWAVDADGRAVPSHYEVRGGSLVQVVDHKGGGFSYPIVADPTWRKRGWFNVGRELIFNRNETRVIAGSAGAAAGILSGCVAAGAGWVSAGCGVLAGALGAFAGYFQLMDTYNKCAKFYLYPAPVPGGIGVTVAPGGQRRGDAGCF